MRSDRSPPLIPTIVRAQPPTFGTLARSATRFHLSISSATKRAVSTGVLVVAGWYLTAHLGYGENPETLEMTFFATNTHAAESLSFVAPLAYSLELLMLSLGTAVALAIPAGCLMAYVRRSASDYVVRVVTIVGVTIPSFWLGIVLILAAYKAVPGFASIGYVPFADRKSTRLNSSHVSESRMPSSA